MKNIIAFIILSFMAFAASAQDWPVDKATGQIVFTGIITIDSSSKDELFVRANEWFAKTYNDSKNVIQMNDKAAGKIIGKGAFKVYAHNFGLKDQGSVIYTISVTVKDNRYKYELNQLYHDATGGFEGARSGGSLENIKPDCGFYLSAKAWDEIKVQSYRKCIEIIESLKLFMGEIGAAEKNNW